VVVVEELAGAVVGAAVTGVTVVDGPVLDGVVVGSDTVVGSSGASAAGSIAMAWLHADASRQPPISKVIRVERTTDNLQIVDRSRHVFRGCSPTTHSVRRGSKP
jgi:tetrahydrodipicolinate N-succinyltransferase